jgi:hypothetical protein
MRGPPSFSSGVLAMCGAIVAGGFLWLTIDVAMRSFPPTGEMHPSIGLFFVPILCAPVILLAVVIHSVLHRFFNYDKWMHWITAGLMYSLILLIIVAGWWMLLIPAFVNPVTVRLLEKRGRSDR